MATQDDVAQRQLGETELLRRAVMKDEAAIRLLVRANNRRLYRIARSIVRDDHEAEDVLQDAYLKAFSALETFRQDSSLSTWLSRIVINEALQRARKRVNTPADVPSLAAQSADIIPFPLLATPSVDPERAVAQSQICRLLEGAIDQLPEEFRVVLIARTLEGMSVAETAELLDLKPETVKTRLHRARQLLRAAISDHLGQLFGDVFPFDGKRCERMTEAVVAALFRLDAEMR